MEAALAKQAVLLLSRLAQKDGTPLRTLGTALLSVLSGAALVLLAVSYILTAPFELASPDLAAFQEEYADLLAAETGIDAAVLTEAEMGRITGAIADSDRRAVVAAALPLVGKVPYFWGGKSAPGWNEAWGTLKRVTAPGNSKTGQYIPYGLDCSGFTNWVFRTALGEGAMPGLGATAQWYGSSAIAASELLPGDLAFLMEPSELTNHVGIYVGKDGNGKNRYVHCSYSGGGVVLNGYGGFVYFRRPQILRETEGIH
jgi:hypothetical protein